VPGYDHQPYPKGTPNEPLNLIWTQFHFTLITISVHQLIISNFSDFPKTAIIIIYDILTRDDEMLKLYRDKHCTGMGHLG